MPFVSRQQQKWGNSPTGVKALGGPDKVKEWNDSTPNGSLLPKKTLTKKPAPVVKGALSRAAKKWGSDNG